MVAIVVSVALWGINVMVALMQAVIITVQDLLWVIDALNDFATGTLADVEIGLDFVVLVACSADVMSGVVADINALSDTTIDVVTDIDAGAVTDVDASVFVVVMTDLEFAISKKFSC